ncbi:MAG TPA: hypothetical protein VGC88_10865 [Terriglobales bacterium]|jgi:hypothetical protein
MMTTCRLLRENEFYRLFLDGVPGRLLVAAEAERWLWEMVTRDRYTQHVVELASLGTTEFTFEDALPILATP